MIPGKYTTGTRQVSQIKIFKLKKKIINFYIM
jgi:hypothetical protein